MKVHDESRAFKCDVCLKVFSYKSIREAHNRTYTGEKPFACKIYYKIFALKSNLVRHQAAHRNDKFLNAVFVQKEDILKLKIVKKAHGLSL